MDNADIFAAIVQSSDAAIVSKDLNGRVLSWNPAAETIFGWTAGEMVGNSIRRIIPEQRYAEEDYILASIVRGESVVRMETVRLRKDGSEVPVAVMVSPVRDKAGVIIGASKIARDISGEVRTRAALDEVEARFSLMADNIAQLAWIADKDGSIYWYNRRWYEYTGTCAAEVQGWDWHKVHHPDHVERVIERLKECLRTGTELEDTFPLRGHDGAYRWFLTRAVPVRDAAGEITCWFGTNTDVTGMREAERRIELLLMEVNHRAKNLLAVVQSLAKRTALSGEDFVERLERRIAGLAANQDVLVQRNWSAVPLDELIEAQLGCLVDLRQQVSLSGPALVIQPSAAEAVSMALHEMATNAEKYGALSTPAGRVEISWNVCGTGVSAEFVLHWRELGGPRVLVPSARGFGSRIIEDVPKGKLRATVITDYAADGFRFTLRCPPGNVLAPTDLERG